MTVKCSIESRILTPSGSFAETSARFEPAEIVVISIGERVTCVILSIASGVPMTVTLS